ncbi:oligosaccharide flippase family protein [Listeria sp. W9-0585]|uniref:Oligosaccharide flippase family protein n=2 Tax=Listeria rustica TaxID=2713503 RepID=A0A7W1T559_9LIST|nr:oligosaccharide flippase family protein [Listeria rustica]
MAQVIVIAVSPILTRLYAPDDFGMFSVYSSILIVLLTFSSLCLEKAIPIEKNQRNVVQLVYISCITISIVAILNTVLYAAFDWSLFTVFQVKTNIWLQLLLSCALVFAGVYQVLSYQAIRQKEYREITASKMGQSFGTAGGQVGLAFVPGMFSGLIIGDVIGRFFGLVMLTQRFLKTNPLQKIRPKRMKYLLWKYREYPLFSTLSTLCNSLSLQLVILLLMSFYGSEVVGYYSLTQKAIGVPITLIGIAISQVFYGEAAEKGKTDRASVYALYMTIIKRLSMVAVPAIIVLVFVAPSLFGFVFGEEWTRSGEFVQYVSFLFLGQLIFMPVSQVLYATGHQKMQLMWDVGRCIIVFAGMYLLHMMGASVEVVLIYFGTVMGLSYFVLGYMGWLVLRTK